MASDVLPSRFIDEDIAQHWNVNESAESFDLLINHIENKTNFKPFFEQAWSDFSSYLNKDEGLVIADIGGGIGWTSALMACEDFVKKVYLIEPSTNRRERCLHVVKHFGGDPSKVELVDGTFQDLKIPEQSVDVAVLSSSFHHCYDKDVDTLFTNVNKILKKDTAHKKDVLISNEHYVHFLWSLRRAASYYIKHPFDKSNIYWGPGNWRCPEPFDGEHWRIRSEIADIFTRNGFDYKFTSNDGDLCHKDPSFLMRLEWTYYYAMLSRKK